jgi:hypothetical protein
VGGGAPRSLLGVGKRVNIVKIETIIAETREDWRGCRVNDRLWGV